MKFIGVVMTCLEPWFIDAVESLNNQDSPLEEKHLLIDSTRPFTDDQKALLEAYSDKLNNWNIHYHPINNDFGSHKTWLLHKLGKQGEWVLWLDADETIGSKFISSAREIIKYSDNNSINKVDAYSLAMIHAFDGRDNIPDIDWLDVQTWLYPDWHIKLFRNSRRVKYNGVVHETLSGYNTVVPLSDPKLTVFHLKTLDMQAESDRRWRRLDVVRREKDPSYLSHLQGKDWEDFANAHEKLI